MTVFYSVSIRQKPWAYYFAILTRVEDCFYGIFYVNMVYVTLCVIHQVIFDGGIYVYLMTWTLHTQFDSVVRALVIGLLELFHVLC